MSNLEAVKAAVKAAGLEVRTVQRGGKVLCIDGQAPLSMKSMFSVNFCSGRVDAYAQHAALAAEVAGLYQAAGRLLAVHVKPYRG